MSPEHALRSLRPGDAALGRLDVSPTLDGVDDGLWVLGALAASGVAVLNDGASLLATHDKLLTARLLRRSGVPHPASRHIRIGRPLSGLEPPVVVKPRFGSGGRDVYRCDDAKAFQETLALVGNKPWYLQRGALIQELVPPRGYDLRILVAGERVVGAVYRVAAADEWRTNIALGGERQAVSDLPLGAGAIALAAARAAGCALVGVDLMLDADGNWTVIELNGAVEFTGEYDRVGEVFTEVVAELGRLAIGELAPVSSPPFAASKADY